MSTPSRPDDKTNSYPRLLMLWQSRGLSARASSVLALACISNVQQITQLGRCYFEGLPGCGAKTIAELAALAGWPAKTPVDAIAAALRLALSDSDEAVEAAIDAIIALRRSGFVITAKRLAPAGRRPLAG